MSVSAVSSSLMPAQMPLSGGKLPTQGTQAAVLPPPPRGAGGKEEMESLLSSQVKAGRLTVDQADTLKGFFQNLATERPRPAKAKDGGPERTGEKPGAPPSNPAANLVSKSVSEALATFLKNLQDSRGSDQVYGSASKAASPPLVIDKTV